MRNFKCSIADMRKRVFAEVAKLAYEGGGTGAYGTAAL